MPTFRNTINKRKNTSNSWTTGFSNSRNTSWSNTGWNRTGGWNTGSFSNQNTTTYSVNSPQFNPIRVECQARIGSYKNVFSQCSGTSKTVFSPTTANKWLKFCNTGTLVYKFTNPQFVKFFGANCTTMTPTACTKFFQQQFGTGIKAVTRGNNNCWLVAATKNVTATPFRNYSWN